MNETIAAFEALFERRADAPLDVLLRDDVVLKPPTYWKAWRGKDAVSRLLRFAAGNIDELRYVRRFTSERTHALQFEAKISELDFAGIDIVTLDERDRIAEVEIVARPPNAVVELSKRMGASIAGDPFFAKAK